MENMKEAVRSFVEDYTDMFDIFSAEERKRMGLLKYTLFIIFVFPFLFLFWTVVHICTLLYAAIILVVFSPFILIEQILKYFILTYRKIKGKIKSKIISIQMPDRDDIQGLVRTLGSENERLRKKAHFHLQYKGIQYRMLANEILKHKGRQLPDSKKQLVYDFTKIIAWGKSENIDELIKFAKSPSYQNNSLIRVEVVNSLGKIKDVRSIATILECIDQHYFARDPTLDQTALKSIFNIIENIKDQTLTNIFIKSLLEGSQKLTKVISATVLGILKDPEAVEPLIKCLRPTQNIVSLSLAASNALLKIGDIRAIDPLINELFVDNYTRNGAAAYALGQIGNVRAVEPLVKLLSTDKKVPRLGNYVYLSDRDCDSPVYEHPKPVRINQNINLISGRYILIEVKPDKFSSLYDVLFDVSMRYYLWEIASNALIQIGKPAKDILLSIKTNDKLDKNVLEKISHIVNEIEASTSN